MKSIKKSLITAFLFSYLTACGGSPGTPGISGSNGSTGATGAQGPAGTNLSIQSGIACSKVDVSFAGAPNYVYTSIVYATGERWIECEVQTGAGTYSESRIFKSGQGGAASGACAVYASLSGDTYGLWNFSLIAGLPKSTYACAGCASGKNGYNYPFIAGDCTLF
jgi:hypothetical protein